MQQGLTEDFYAHVADYHDDGRYSEQEQLAIEYAERFLLDHTNIDDAFFARLRSAFSDPEILDLTICIATFLGLGRLLRVLGVDQTCEVDVGRMRPPTESSSSSSLDPSPD
jgi:alkylhydroperoxidase family enzyme